MGRTRTFNNDAVLAAAMNLFRQRGFRDVSITDLEAATGLTSGSIYNAFHDKAGLFRAALDFYVHHFVGSRLEVFTGGNATLDDLERLFLSVLEPPLADGHGCLVNNSIVEFGRGGGLADAGIAEALGMVRDGIAAVLRRELGTGASEAATTHLVVLYHGILTLSRSQTPFELMADMVRVEFNRLRLLRTVQFQA